MRKLSAALTFLILAGCASSKPPNVVFLGSGIEFVHMRDEDREKLRKLVQRHLQL